MLPAETRRPAVAGTFYPRNPTELRELVSGFLATVDAQPEGARGAIAPHAGLVYSGQCAAHVFKRVAVPPVVVVLAPNHTGHLGVPGGASLWPRGAFATPLGEVPVNAAFAEALAARCPLAVADPFAHMGEHAVEVELPFLQVSGAGTSIVPIVLAWDDWPRCRTLAEALAELVRSWPQSVFLLASSDMTHYEHADRAATKDRMAIAAIERLDGQALLEACHRHNITMCGRAAAAVMLEAARLLGASRARLVDYRHSGWVTGDNASVVAYAGFVTS
jgi:AmmeMemoRadiSam system protein B